MPPRKATGVAAHVGDDMEIVGGAAMSNVS
jgi:hypothetical protein